jgi:predicted permease
MSAAAALDLVLRDIRFAVRLLRKSPGFTITAVVTLGLTIGANTAVFSVVDALLVRPLPYPEPGRLALVATRYQSAARGVSGEQTSQDGRMWEAIRDRATALDPAVYSGMVGGVNLVTPAGAAFVQQQRVSAGYFRVIGVPPLVGREFDAEEDVPNGPPVAIVSHALWQRALGGVTDPVGTTITLRGESHTVVGVMPPAFDAGQPVDVWTPLRPSTRGEGGGTNYTVIARVKPGITWPQADAEIAAIGAQASEGQVPADWSVVHGLMPLKAGLTADVRQAVLIAWGAVALVLLIACVNLAGLMLARAGRRRREIATRLAIGSSRAAILRQLFTESLLVAAAGGLLGLLLGGVAMRALGAVAAAQYGIYDPLALDGRALAVTAFVALIAAVLFGLAPAFQATRVDVQPALTETGARGASAGIRWSRRMLVVAEVALGVVLLVSAGLLVRTFAHLRGLEPGFDAREVTTATVSLQDARYREAARVSRFLDDSLTEIRGMPGVQAAGVALGLPYQRLLNLGFTRPGDPEPSLTNLSYVAGDYFQALRIPVLRGRVFGPRDRGDAPRVVVVNEAFVRRYFPGEEPLGRRIALSNSEREIVGVVGSVQVTPGWGNMGPIAAAPLVYVPASQTSDAFLQLVHTWFSPAFVVRAGGASHGIEAGISRAVAAVDPMLPVAGVQSLEEIRGRSMSHARFMAGLLVALGGIAGLLAAIGLHALIAASVTERTREIAIRLALGASPGGTVRAIALSGVALAAAGVLSGLVLASWAVPLLRSQLHGIVPTDAPTFSAVILMVLIVALVASTLPALRILQLDPADTLRAE